MRKTIWVTEEKIMEKKSSITIKSIVAIGIGAALLQMGIAALTGEIYFRLVGASGAVMGLLLAFGVMHPNNQIYIMPLPFPIKAKWFVIGYAVLEIALGWSGVNTGIAHFAHVGGMLWGLALLFWWRKRGKIFF